MIILPVVNVVYAKFVAEFNLGAAAQLASVIVAGPDTSLEVAVEARGVRTGGKAPSPVRVALSGATEALSPLTVLGHLLHPDAGGLPLLFRPGVPDLFPCLCRVTPAGGFWRTVFHSFGHELPVFRGSFVGGFPFFGRGHLIPNLSGERALAAQF